MLLETEMVKATCGTYRCFEPFCGFFFMFFFWQGLLVFPTKINCERGVRYIYQDTFRFLQRLLSLKGEAYITR